MQTLLSQTLYSTQDSMWWGYCHGNKWYHLYNIHWTNTRIMATKYLSVVAAERNDRSSLIAYTECNCMHILVYTDSPHRPASLGFLSEGSCLRINDKVLHACMWIDTLYLTHTICFNTYNLQLYVCIIMVSHIVMSDQCTVLCPQKNYFNALCTMHIRNTSNCCSYLTQSGNSLGNNKCSKDCVIVMMHTTPGLSVITITHN